MKMKAVQPKHLITIINVYAPHSERVRNDQQELDEMYTQLSTVFNELKPKSKLTFLAGDWNSKVGKNNDNTPCLGRYSKGKRNYNGEYFIEFCNINNLFVCNSAFCHPSRHITTWECQMKDKNDPAKTFMVYNQIDYIVCEASKKHLLVDSRSYKGTETSSDHRLLICRVKIGDYEIFRVHNKQIAKKYNTKLLICNEEMRNKFASEVHSYLNEQNNNNIQPSWEKTRTILTTSAEKTVGLADMKHHGHIHNPVIEKLSIQQKNIRLEISECTNSNKIADLKSKRNQILHEITQTLNKQKNDELNSIASEINKSKDNAKMYRAVKLLKRKHPQKLILVDEEGKSITNEEQCSKIVAKHFEGHFTTHDEQELEAFITEPQPLNNPITQKEVAKSVSKFSNNKASDSHNISAELVKYGPSSLNNEIACILNHMFEHNEYVNVGEGLMVPIRKPKKPKGPIKNPLKDLRPVTLLPIIRKVLSNITLARIQPQVEKYLSPAQAAYRPNRSTADIVWTHKFLIARTQLYQNETIYVVGIDMSSAFDTIYRNKLLHILKDIIGEDELRIIRVLLSNTTLTVRSKSGVNNTFKTNIGSPQGDGLSGCLFNIYFENALKEVRTSMQTNDLDNEHAYARPTEKQVDTLLYHDHPYAINMPEPTMPDETCYADDGDFIYEKEFEKDKLLFIVGDVLLIENLQVNCDKTEVTEYRRENNKSEEKWRHVIKLGTTLGDTEEMIRRKQLSIVAMKEMNELWSRKDKVQVAVRNDLYKTLVKPILLYNSGTWSLTSGEEELLNAFHRKQLRRVLGVKYPVIMENTVVFEQSGETPLSLKILKSRWSLFGHTFYDFQVTYLQDVQCITIFNHV